MNPKARPTELEREFAKDHQVLTRGLARVLDAVEEGDLDRARALADELDREAGPHIRFEEEVYYPRLRSRLGEDFVEQLYGEHDEGQEAIRSLLRSEGPLQPDEVAHHLRTALEHALSCGTLLSHLEGLSDEEREKMVEQLRELREQSVRWTEVEESG